MKKCISRTLCILLLVAMALASVACGTEGTEASDPNTSKTQSTSSSDERVLFDNLPDVKYGGKTITFLVEGDYAESLASVEIMPQETDYEELRNAVSTRNGLVEERFEVQIQEVRTENSGDMVTKLRSNNLAATSEYDIVMPFMADAARIAQEGMFYDLNKLSDIHLECDYYDQGSVKDLSINNKNYFVTGDLSLMTYNVTHALVFNKDIIDDYGLENPYTLVMENKWTIDKLQEMARQVTSNVDGEPGMSYLDNYGFLVNGNFVSSMYMACGQRFTRKDAADEPVLVIGGETSSAVFDRIFELVNDDQATGKIDFNTEFGLTAIAAGKTIWKAATESVANKHTLFRAMSLYDVLDLGDYECRFGILPIPKYNEMQDEYYCRVSTLGASCIAIPVNVEDPQMVSVIADAMMQASTGTIKRSYFDVIMKSRRFKDEESEDMLDIIFRSRVYDFATVYNWGGTSEYDTNSLSGFMNDTAFSGKNTFVSTWQRIQGTVQADMEETIAAYRTLED